MPYKVHVIQPHVPVHCTTSAHFSVWNSIASNKHASTAMEVLSDQSEQHSDLSPQFRMVQPLVDSLLSHPSTANNYYKGAGDKMT